MGYREYDDDDLDLDFEDEDETPKQSASNDNLVKQLRKQLKAEQRRAKELEEQYQSVAKVQRESSIKSILSEYGLNPNVAKFVDSNIEPTADALKQWIDENGSLFGLQQQAQQSEQVAPNLAARRQIDAATANALSPELADDIALRISQATDPEALMQMLYTAEQ